MEPCSPQNARKLHPAARGLCALVAMAALGWIGLAAGLQPDPRGHSTHTQLGLEKCMWRLEHHGNPCPSCGMTTAFTRASHGDLGGALKVQPAGALLAVAASLAFWIGLWGATTGSVAVKRVSVLFKPVGWLGMASIVVASWLYTLNGG